LNPRLRRERTAHTRAEALIWAMLHNGLRHGSVPATGNFQRLRGRPPLV